MAVAPLRGKRRLPTSRTCRPAGRELAAVACFSPAATPRGRREGEHEPEQAGKRETDPRMGADSAAVRLARAAALRADTSPGALRRAGLGTVRGGRPLAEHPVQEARRLRVRG